MTIEEVIKDGVIEAPYMDSTWISAADRERLRELVKRTSKSESEVVSTALRWYYVSVQTADLMADKPWP